MTTPQAAPLVDLQRLVVAIRRRRRLWLATTLLGLILGGALALFLPPAPTAVTEVIVIHQGDSATDSGTLMKTDVTVLGTTQIASEALKKAKSTESVDDFTKDYSGLGLTNNVMQITVKAKTSSDAVAKAKALAETFIADHVQRAKAAAQSQSQAFLDQGKLAQNQLTDVNSQISVLEGQGKHGDQATLENLYTRRAALTSQISDFQSRAQQAGVGNPEIAAGTQVVDAARALPRGLLKAGATNAGVGLALGLALGIALAAVSSIVRDRPVLRREISAALGASVIAQLPSRRRGPARLWKRSRGVADTKRVATTLARLAKDDPGSVSLLELGTSPLTAALALDMAEELGCAVVDDLPDGGVATLAAELKSDVKVVAPGTSSDERRLGVGSVSPGTAWTDLAHLGAETVLVVRAGEASTLWLHTVARQLADCEIPLAGVVLVDPDPRDHTDGTLWDGLHTALRGRAAHLPELTDLPLPDLPAAAEPAPHVTPDLPAAVDDDELAPRVIPDLPAAAEEDQPAPRVIERVVVEADAPTRAFAPMKPVPPVRPVRPVPPTPDVAAPGRVSVPDADAPTKKFAPVMRKRPTPFKRDHDEPAHSGELDPDEHENAEVS